MPRQHTPQSAFNQPIQDIIATPPGCLLHSGLTILAIVVVVAITLAAFIRYPDKIRAKGIMTSQSPPIDQIAKSNGIIEAMFVSHGAVVKAGEPIVYLQNPAKRQDVEKLKDFLAAYTKVITPADYLQLTLPMPLQLGELQSRYASLELAFQELLLLLRQSGTAQQINTLKNELEKTDQLYEVLQKERDLAEKELEVIRLNYERSKKLQQEKVVSDLEAEKAAATLLTYEKQLNNLENGLIQNRIRKEQLQLEMLQLDEGRSEAINAQRFVIEERVHQLLQGIATWEETWLVQASVGGVLSFKSSTVLNQYVTANQALASIIPEGQAYEHFVRVVAAETGIGKIQPGDKTILKIDGYPYKEYGTVISYLKSISLLPEQDQEGNSFYELTIPLPDTITTNYGKSIPFRPNTGLSAEVITDDQSLLQRILYQFLNLINNNIK
ncbi:MAG TPA: HlyD family efflux transporter periplasmic adaptor subunit [Saprospiraceae bacterium]|nr:HlyD family efflux transporter periplasmic adaptor subunit [Saprospiraceae bacterium]HMQ85470.1 HlyD family efflux transporter periplasmic adaptor subunit [Saprospiraceae bacterium]